MTSAFYQCLISAIIDRIDLSTSAFYTPSIILFQKLYNYVIVKTLVSDAQHRVVIYKSISDNIADR